MTGERNAERAAAALLCLAASAVLLWLCSMSSPLFPLNIWDDANCLFTVGRMMREGGVLYRDIYEQKGPLLYAIQMLAACLSDTSYAGVYIMEVLAFAATLGAAYVLMRRFAGHGAALGGMLLFGACTLVSRAFARGNSAEEFCLPFLMAALALVCTKEDGGALGLGRLFALGMLAGCVAMIKYTILGLFLGLCLAQGLWLLARRAYAQVLRSAGAFLAGMVLPILPWIAYFAAHGALEDAYTAYIHNNIFLYNAGGTTLTGLCSAFAKAGWDNLPFALPAALGVLCFAGDSRQGGFVRLAAALAALASCAAVFLVGAIYPYYPLVLCVFAPLGLMRLMAWAQGRLRFACPLAFVLALCMAVFLSPSAFLRGVPLSETAQGRLAAQMEPGATLLQYSHLDDGLYLASGALPQEKFFVRLNVALPEMNAALDEALRAGRPDYVLVSWRTLPEAFDRYEMVAWETGYDNDGQLKKDLVLYRRVK